jgi:ATP-dependent Clp protease adaptor protein ClpS
MRVGLEKFHRLAKILCNAGSGSELNLQMAVKRQDGTILETEKAKVKPPPMYKVVLCNDDFTPMEFVILVLQKFFLLSREQATRIMLKVHTEGRGVCGVYPLDLASTKVEQVMAFAKQHQHPLQCVMEET